MTDGVTLSWSDLQVTAPLSRTERKKHKQANLPPDDKCIIHKNSGQLQPGQLTAILGASGCGKTTFINFLAKRKFYLRSLNVSGTAYLNGHNIDTIDFNTAAGYVMQEDVILPIFTVREVLEFTSRLRLPSSQYMAQVDKVIKDLGLRACEHTVIGHQLEKGISGGERKRTSIAIEMLIDPIILFLDEPTTGLDSHSAESLVKLLNELCVSKALTIVMVIHQPNSYCYASFTNLLLMAKGRIFYNGPGRDAVGYFASLGYQCPKFNNPAEFFIEMLAEDDRLNDLCSKIEHNSDPPVVQRSLPSLERHHHAAFPVQLWTLGQKVMLSMRRNYQLFYYKLGAHLLFIALVFSTFYEESGATDETSVVNRAGKMSFIFLLVAFVSINAAAAYADQKAMFIREQLSDTYSPGAYYLSKLMFETPPNLLMTVLFATASYLAIGLSTEKEEQIIIFVLICVLLNLGALGLGNLLIMAIPSSEAAIAVSPIMILMQVLMGGVVISYDKIPVYFYWLEYSSLFKYAWSAAMLNEFDTFDRDECGGGEVCDAVDFYGIEWDVWDNIAVLFGIMVILQFTAFLALLWLSVRLRS